MSNLTKFQDKLITELKGEFERINPSEVKSTSKRFSLDTINKCINEEDDFRESVYSYNKKVIATLKKQFFDELKKLKKEFDNLIVFNDGHMVSNILWGGWESFEKHYKDPQTNSVYSEIILVNTKKENPNNYTTSLRYFDGKDYRKITCLFETQSESIILESGKEIKLFKVIGLRYTTKDWLHLEGAVFGSSLDELIQIDKDLQQKIVALLK
jgi:hypothetical protein